VGTGTDPGGVDPLAVLGLLPDPVVVVDQHGVILWGNDVAESVFGWSREAALGRDATELIHPDDLTTALVSLISVQDKPIGTLVEVRVRDDTGKYRRVEVRGRSAVDVDGVDGIVLALRDVTDRRRWELASGDAAASIAVLDALPTMAFVLSPVGRLRSANRAFTRILGHPLETSLGRPLTDFVSVAKVFAVSESIASVTDGHGRVTFEAELLDVDGDAHPMSITLVDLVADEAVRGLVATATDISALAAVRDRLAHAATHDSLTGLPNRLLLQERLSSALSNAATRDGRVGVVFVDVDQLKVVNDTYGHRAGDQVLVEVAHRLAAAVRDSDLVARYGGDEFVVVASGLDHRSLGRLVDRISWLMQTPVALELGGGQPDIEVRVTLGVGAVIADDAITIDEAIEQADAALLRIRAHRRQRHA
jgi:diguanylate cyclase (GGDEF)-like protein/PAS domain S-box-containing protein